MVVSHEKNMTNGVDELLITEVCHCTSLLQKAHFYQRHEQLRKAVVKTIVTQRILSGQKV